jgi:hypothetical protein
VAEPEKITPPAQIAGVWATDTRVYRTRDDFTFDFWRVDPAVPPPGRHILVARVALSPRAAGSLRDSLGDRWREYERGILPNEVQDGET